MARGSSFATKNRPIVLTGPNDKIKELEEICALNMAKYERQLE